MLGWPGSTYLQMRSLDAELFCCCCYAALLLLSAALLLPAPLTGREQIGAIFTGMTHDP